VAGKKNRIYKKRCPRETNKIIKKKYGAEEKMQTKHVFLVENRAKKGGALWGGLGRGRQEKKSN